MNLLRALNGPQTLGNGRAFWISFGVVVALALAYPLASDSYTVDNVAYMLLWVFMALGLSLMWGYGGILSFGQTFFFGVAGYAYGVMAIDFGGGGTTIAALALIYFIFMRTRFGVHARATMQNAAIAQALGVKVGNIYALSFGIGAALAGFCGALYAPTMTLIPTMGATFIVESFVTVVVGGANVLLGTAPAGLLLAAVRTLLNASQGQIVGQIGMLLAVIVIIRLLPEGISGLLARRSR